MSRQLCVCTLSVTAAFLLSYLDIKNNVCPLVIRTVAVIQTLEVTHRLVLAGQVMSGNITQVVQRWCEGAWRPLMLGYWLLALILDQKRQHLVSEKCIGWISVIYWIQTKTISKLLFPDNLSFVFFCHQVWKYDSLFAVTPEKKTVSRYNVKNLLL